MQQAFFILLACLAGQVLGKQVTLSPPTTASSPPPPATTTAPVVTYSTPGLVFSLIVPGTTSLSTFAQTDICAAIAAGLRGPGFNSTCVPSSTAPFNGTSTIFNGYTFSTWATVPTPDAVAVATSLRNSYLQTLTTNITSVLPSAYSTVSPNCACNGVSTVTAEPATEFVYSTNVTSPGPVQCGARLVAPSGVTQVGIDDGSVVPGNRGKFCSSPAVTGGILGVPGTPPCVPYGVVASSQGTGTARVDNAANEVDGVSSGLTTVGTLSSAGSGYTSAPTATVSAPTQVAAVVSVTLAAGVPTIAIDNLASNGPYPTGTGTVRVTSVTYPTGTTCIGKAAGACSGVPGQVTIAGTTSTGPTCTLADWQDTTVVTGGVAGQNTFTVTATVFDTVTTGANFLCSGTPVLKFSSNFIPMRTAIVSVDLDPADPGKLADPVIVDGGSGYLKAAAGDLWAPQVTISSPTTGNLGKLCSPTPIPLPAAIAINAPVTGNIASDNFCQPIGLNIYSKKPCSIPSVAGGDWIARNSFTCNVVSSFIPQPGATSAANTCGVVAQTFVASAPSSPPTPGPSPPAPTTAPVPSPSTTASYRGRFQIGSVACKGRFIAASANCGDRSVLLRTVSQSKGSRTFWVIDGTAGVATGLTSVVRIGTCNGRANLASAQSTPTPVIGGPSWKVKLTPVDASKPNVVTIEATDKTYKGKFLQVGDKCDDQKSFVWAAKSSSTGQQWELTALSNVN